MTSALIRFDYTLSTEPNSIETYIRKLRHELIKLYKENLTYQNIELILSNSNLSILPFDNNIITKLPENFYYSITSTLDPNRFLNLEFTTQENQIHYFKQIITTHITTDVYHHIYATFEEHKNGIIHCHAIIRIYDQSASKYKQILHAFTSKLTNQINSKINTIIKITSDIEGWLKYMNKETKEPPISFNMNEIPIIQNLDIPSHKKIIYKKPLEIISTI